MISTDLHKKDIAALPHRKLVDLTWMLAKAADEATEHSRGQGYSREEARDECVITPEQILGEIETVTSDFADDREAVAAQKRTRARNAAYWSAELAYMLDDRLDDGTPVLAIVFAENPDLARRLREALTR